MKSKRPIPAQVQPVVIHFVLRQYWFNEMLAGRKDIEYRNITPYWTARLIKRHPTMAIFRVGYQSTRRRMMCRILAIDTGPCPYPGWHGEFYRVHLSPMDNHRDLDLGSWQECENCGGEGTSDHDCGEDTCCCLDPENNMTCDICQGKGGFWYCDCDENGKYK